MLPVYDPKSFASIDLRKYHIRDIRDVIKFNEFVASRLDEAQFVIKKFNNQFATYKTVTQQLQNKVTEEQKEYGAPTKPEDQPQEIQSVEENDSAEKIHQELINDIRQAVAEEKVAPQEEDEDPNERAIAEYENYKVVDGKKYPMFYRKDSSGYRLVAKVDVPEDIAQKLLATIGKE